MHNRELEDILLSFFDYKKAIILQGARQVGKTTLIESVLENKSDVLWVDGDDPQDRSIWNNITKANIRAYLTDYTFIVFDEAQRFENIGLTIKMILDLKLKKQIIVSGSSVIHLTSNVNEPLTGRKWSFELFPFSWKEMAKHLKLVEAIKQLDQFLIFGLYPEIATAKTHKIKRLKELTNSYLYKDILEVSDIRKPEIITRLLQALAYQVGSEVSYNELANMLQINNETVKKYISLLEDSYVIFTLPPLSTNPRKEISTSRKIYFYDNGVRNTLINNFDAISLRNDIGILWENFIVSEFVKRKAYHQTVDKLYFWRSKSGSEIDLVTQTGDNYAAYEIKYNPRKKAKFNPSFLENYKPEIQETVSKENFFSFL